MCEQGAASITVDRCTQELRQSDIFTGVDFPGIGKAPIAATPVKLHGTPGDVRRRAPTLGEHSDEILKAVGYTDAELDDMRRKGAI